MWRLIRTAVAAALIAAAMVLVFYVGFTQGKRDRVVRAEYQLNLCGSFGGGIPGRPPMAE